MHENELYKDSQYVATRAVEMFTPSLGARDGEILMLKYTMARNLYSLGHLFESERVLRKLASDHSDDDKQPDDTGIICFGYLSNVWRVLGKVLSRMGRMEEASSWFEKSFKFALSTYGVNHASTRRRCYDLCDCYESQSRYDDALNIYHRMIDEHHKLGAEPDGAFAQYEAEISRIEEWLRCNSSSSHEESDDTDQSEWESVYSEEEVEAEAEAEDDAGGQDAEMTNGASDEEGTPENEDWKMFICEDQLLLDSQQERN
jgi:tetratricopeptide (TPR) repeat protein